MKALTIKQPWASAIMSGYKRFEFRTWQTKYRGELLIHAGKGIDKEAMERLKKYLPKEIPFGKILGKVNLTDCIKVTPQLQEELLKENNEIYTNNSFKSDYAWKLENIEVFDKPIETKGMLSLWEYDYKD